MSTAVATTHNKDMARDFLAALDPLAREFTFQFIGDTRSGRAETFHGTLDQAWRRIEALNNAQSRVGAFVTINETDLKGRKSENIVRARALFVDADGSEQVKHCESALATSGIIPSAVVTTGRGKHYYFLTEVPREKFSNYQQVLIDKLGTDRSIKDLPRVMRLPGTLHLKDPSQPRLVTLEPHPGLRPRFSADALVSALGASSTSQPTLSATATPTAPPSSQSTAPSPTAAPAGSPADFSCVNAAIQQLLKHATDRLSDGLEAEIEEIRSAALAIPSSALASEHEWVRVARGFAREAAIFPASRDKLYAILDEMSARAPGYDRNENRQRWDRYRDEAFDSEKSITIATFFKIAKDHGWSGSVPTSLSSPSLATTPNTPAPTQVAAPRAVPIASLPRIPKKREWLCGTYLMRGAISLLSAPGARGKTAFLITFAMTCASGRALLDANVFGGAKTVLYLSTEEPTDEINLRLRAAMQHHGVGEADLSGLHVIGAERWSVNLIVVNRGVPLMDENGWKQLVTELDLLHPDILIIDTLVGLLGGADANSNSVASLLMGRLVKLATTRKMAVMIAHHVAKGRDPLAADSAMGAASFVNLSRIALSIDALQEARAGDLGLPPWEARFVFRVVGTKQNYSPVKPEDDWFRLAQVEVPNAQPPTYPNGDSVGVVERFTPQASGAAMFPPELLRSALQAIQDADPPLTPSARSNTRYAVPVIAKAIAPHRGGRASEAEAKAILGHLIDVALAKVEERKISREGSRSDIRKGLFPTEDGAELLRDIDMTPQPPQSPATSFAGDTVAACGDQPSGSPATQGGCGGRCGGEDTRPEPVSHAVSAKVPSSKDSGRSGQPAAGSRDGTNPALDITPISGRLR